jgi:hypothetical protein
MVEYLKVWYNPEYKWYEVFLPDGTEVAGGMMQVRVSRIDDTFKDSTTAIIKSVVEVVNERPVKQSNPHFGANTGTL